MALPPSLRGGNHSGQGLNLGDYLGRSKSALEQLGVELKLTDKLVNGKIVVDGGIIAGCAGGMYDNIAEAAAILEGLGDVKQ